MSEILGVSVWRWWNLFEGTVVDDLVVADLNHVMRREGWVSGQYCCGSVPSQLLGKIHDGDGRLRNNERDLLAEELAPFVYVAMFGECGL